MGKEGENGWRRRDRRKQMVIGERRRTKRRKITAQKV